MVVAHVALPVPVTVGLLVVNLVQCLVRAAEAVAASAAIAMVVYEGIFQFVYGKMIDC